MRRRLHTLALALLVAGTPLTAAAEAPQAPSGQELVFYNARLALRDGKPQDALKLWLVRNALVQRGEPAVHDAAFRSVVWAALGDTGLCQDGFPEDDAHAGGAGLWPLAFHNWLLLASARGAPPAQPTPFDAFAVGHQQRFFSLRDVLTAEEVKAARFFPSVCLRPYLARVLEGELPWMDFGDRLVVGRMMRGLLERALTTLAPGQVRGRAAVEARLFDLDLALAELEGRRARAEGAGVQGLGRSLGLSPVGAADARQRAEARMLSPWRQGFLRRSLTWSPDEWLTLEPERRLFLFARARPLATDPVALRALVLAVVDRLVAQGQGAQAAAWVSFLEAREAPAVRQALTAGARGERLLALEPATGFRERAVVALHRGVAFLEAGQQTEALRSFAWALAHAEESREAEATAALSRRWLSYALSFHAASGELVATLAALVPPQDFAVVLEDLLWRAALRADRASLERLEGGVRRGSALEARLDRLRPLAAGRPGQMLTALREQAREEPHAVLRFTRTLLERLEAEDADVRRANVPTLKGVLALLRPLLDEAEGGKAQVRLAEELSVRTRGLLEGLGEVDASEAGRVASVGPRRETYAGAVRLAPADPLPWPFPAPEVAAPSAFAPMRLSPVEWRDAKGERVWGWRVSG
jgi:hypothetical protein